MVQRKKFIAFVVVKGKHKTMRTHSRKIIIIIIVLSSFAKIPNTNNERQLAAAEKNRRAKVFWNGKRNLTAMGFWY